MSLTVRITTDAYNDINANILWWAENRSAEQSLRWHIGIMEFIESLGEVPQSHSLVSENITSTYETREAYFGLSGQKTHRVIFRILPDTIEVLLVRHLS